MIREQIAAVISKDAMKSQETMRAEWTTFVNDQDFGNGPNQPDRPKLINNLVDQEWEEIQPKRVRALAKADKVLALLSPTPSNDTLQGRGEVGTGWVAWNPDSGEEYTRNHPVRSGECVEAEHIRPSTPQEDVLWQAFQDQFMRAEALSAALQKDTRHDG